MPSNFLQWNPNATNQETDTQYSADAMRSGGASNPSIYPSALANKLFYQISTFVAAFAQAMSNKGYTLSDANLTNLANTLASVMTNADMYPYALLASPAFSGSPTVPTPPASDNSARIPNTAWVDQTFAPTAWVQAYYATMAWVQANYAPTVSPALQGSPTVPTPAAGDNSLRIPNTNWISGNFQPSLGYTPVHQGGGAGQGNNNVYVGWNGASSHLKAQVDSTDQGLFAMFSDFPSSFSTSSANGYQKLPSGLILQWGLSPSVNQNSAVTVVFPISFPNVNFMVTASYSNNTSTTQAAGGNPFNIYGTGGKTQFGIYNGGNLSAQYFWFAIGY